MFYCNAPTLLLSFQPVGGGQWPLQPWLCTKYGSSFCSICIKLNNYTIQSNPFRQITTKLSLFFFCQQTRESFYQSCKVWLGVHYNWLVATEPCAGNGVCPLQPPCFSCLWESGGGAHQDVCAPSIGSNTGCSTHQWEIARPSEDSGVDWRFEPQPQSLLIDRRALKGAGSTTADCTCPIDHTI